LESWKDPEYRAEFVRERVRSSVALQIRALREQRDGMTQKQLGHAIGKAQTWISVLEDPEYGKMSVATLLSLAEAFDIDLEIKFRPFSRALRELTNQGPDYFEVRSFEQELPDLESAATRVQIAVQPRHQDIASGNSLVIVSVNQGIAASGNQNVNYVGSTDDAFPYDSTTPEMIMLPSMTGTAEQQPEVFR
jgi:transcriptional regulator with XRE-family HTH domain